MYDANVIEATAPVRDLVPMPARGEVVLPDKETARAKLNAIREFQATVREVFVSGHDYGTIPGTGNKPTLLKPGAEKLAKLLELHDHYEFVDRVDDWRQGFFNYTIRCQLIHMHTGIIVSEGVGNCNSMESKYRWRWVWPNDLTKEQRDHLRTVPGATRKRNTRNGEVDQFRVENDDIYSQVNTILKMSAKRALVAAALSAGRLSEIFTQDLEDFADDGPSPGPDAAPTTQPSQSSGRQAAKVTSESDPLWQRWVATLDEASQLGISVTPLTLPQGQHELREAGKALRAEINKVKGQAAASDEDPGPHTDEPASDEEAEQSGLPL